MVKIKGKNYESLVVTESDTTFVVHGKAELFSGGIYAEDDMFAGYAIVEDPDASPDGNTYKINGDVSGFSGGIMTTGTDTTIKVGKGAEVSATMSILGGGILGSVGSAIATTGENSKVSIARGAEITGLAGVAIGAGDSKATNNGRIHDAMMGMVAGPITGDATGLTDIRLVNNGRIDSSAIGMMSLGADGAVLENGKDGEIVTYLIGMAASPTDGSQTTTINNFGTVRVTMSLPPEESEGLFGAAAAIMGGLGDDAVRNSGKIFGDIMLADGNDVLDNRGGKVVGRILGGEGDDMLILGKAGDVLIELADEGIDTVKSRFTYTLSENVENLVLTGRKDIDATGNGLDNILTGNKGDNLLTGGAGTDTFVFGTRGGRDTIADFVSGEDQIDLSGWAAIGDFETLLDAATDVGGSVQIKAGKDVLVIDGVLAADLVETDFNFAIV